MFTLLSSWDVWEVVRTLPQWHGNILRQCAVHNEALLTPGKQEAGLAVLRPNLYLKCLLYVLPTQCVSFVWISEETAIISLFKWSFSITFSLTISMWPAKQKRIFKYIRLCWTWRHPHLPAWSPMSLTAFRMFTFPTLPAICWQP